jgi:hypothetical protein
MLKSSEFEIHKSKVKMMEENEVPKNKMTNEATLSFTAEPMYR